MFSCASFLQGSSIPIVVAVRHNWTMSVPKLSDKEIVLIDCMQKSGEAAKDRAQMGELTVGVHVERMF